MRQVEDIEADSDAWLGFTVQPRLSVGKGDLSDGCHFLLGNDAKLRFEGKLKTMTSEVLRQRTTRLALAQGLIFL